MNADIEVINPWSGCVERRYRFISPAQVDAILERSRAGFAVWSHAPLAQRCAGLRALAAALRARREALAAMMTAEMGKRHSEALAEVEKSAGVCDYYAEHAAEFLRDTPLNTDGLRSYLRAEPVGCVFAIMPWNFPIWQVFRFLAPTLALGNVALLKHATNVPGCADLIAEAANAAGLPAGVFAVLHIDNDAAARVIADPRVCGVTLTGSERAGRSVAAEAGRHLKKSVMELGGSDPFIVLADANLEAALSAAIGARYDNAGQTCIAAKRFIIEAAIADRFTGMFVAAAQRLQVSNPALDDCSLAPMARADLRDSLHAQVQRSVAAGARTLLGGELAEHPCAYPATVLDRVTPAAPAYNEELFGPVATLLIARDADDAVRLVNDTRFGLGASLWTRDLDRAEQLVAAITTGTVFVNARVRSDYAMAFGGCKQSGFGRELGLHGLHEFANLKSVYVQAAG